MTTMTTVIERPPSRFHPQVFENDIAGCALAMRTLSNHGLNLELAKQRCDKY